MNLARTRILSIDGIMGLEMNRFRIVFEGFPEREAALFMSQGYLGFKLTATPDVEDPSYSYVFGVQHADVYLQFDALRRELGEAFDQAIIRWAVARVEERLRLGRIPPEPTRETEKLILTEPDLSVLRSMALDKTCEYQTRSARDLFCSAASPRDETAVGSEGLRRLAPHRVQCAKDATCQIPITYALT